MRALFAAVEEADELPVIAMHRNGWWKPVRHAGIVREVLEDGFASQRVAFQRRKDAVTVESLPFDRFDREGFEQRGIIVFALDDRISTAARFGDSRPHHDTGHACAAFKHRRLAAAQRAVAGGRGAIDFVVHVAAVVGGEDDDRVVGQLEPVETIEQRADGVVHALDHRGVGRAALRVLRVDAAAMRLDVRLLRVKGRMHAEHPVVQVKRLLFLLLDPRHRLRRHAVLDVLAGRLLFEVRKLPRRDKAARRARPRMMRQIEIKPLLQR